MLYKKNNLFNESNSPHSIGLQNNMTIPTPGWDSNALMINEKKYWGETNSNGWSGFAGLGCSGGELGMVAIVALAAMVWMMR